MSPQSSGAKTGQSGQRQKSTSSSTTERVYVIDTSVLLSDPQALFRFAEHAVVIPVVVISELEKKRHDPEIGYFARQALRILDDLRIKHERLDFPSPSGRVVRSGLNLTTPTRQCFHLDCSWETTTAASWLWR